MKMHWLIWCGLFVFNGCSTVERTPSAAEQVSGPLVSQLLVTPSAVGHQPFINAIASARGSVRLAMFHLSDRKVVLALVSTAERVNVRVILDRASLDHARERIKAGKGSAADRQLVQAYGRLHSDGSKVQVRLSSPGFAILHEKALVIDGDTPGVLHSAFVTAINLTNGADTTRDFGIVTHDEGMIREISQVFDSDWQHFEDRDAFTPPVSNAHLVWSPVNSEGRLAELIKSGAGHAVIATVENLDDPVILGAFVESAHAGARVRMILPQCDKNKDPLHNYGAIEGLVQQGIEVRVMPYPPTNEQPYMHSKMIAVHGGLAYVGSANFSSHSTLKSRELGAIFDDSAPVARIESIFEDDWKKAVSPSPRPQFCTPVLN